MRPELDAGQIRLLRRAVELAHAAREGGDPPFGSLLADITGHIVAEARNTTITDDDITAHPELKLARWAAANRDSLPVGALTMYTSCEPCPMCAEAIGRSGIPRVVFALSTAQLQALKPAGMPPPSRPVRSEGPYLTSESSAPVAGYYWAPSD